jgi:O-methyltransferase involved in polyketide biosynthesis
MDNKIHIRGEKMNKEKINLKKEKETLLVPLYCKALESKKSHPIIEDKKALEIIAKIEYEFERLKIPKQTFVTICIRAKIFDNYAKYFLKVDSETSFVHIGSGLDSRFLRVDNGKLQWYELDYPDVIKLRKLFYEESDRYHFIGSGVMNLDWIQRIVKRDHPYVFLAEGLFMYLKEEEVKNLIFTLQKEFPGSYLVFDTYSATTAKNVKNHPSLKKIGVEVKWGINDAKDITKWGKNLKFVEEKYFTDSEETAKLDYGYRLIFKIASLFPIAKKAHRIIVFQLK